MALKAHPQRYQPGTVRAGDCGHLHLVLAAGIALVAASALLVADAVVNTRAFFDLRLMRAIQAIDVPYPGLVLRPVDALTSSVGAVSAWALVLLALLAARWWVPASTVFVLPLAGALDNAIGWFIVERQRPTLDEVLRVRPGTDPSSFPSGHVLGAVVLYGLLFVIAERIGSRWARWTLKALCVWVIALVGFARVWYGAHWPTDVLGAYAMGGVLLLGLLTLYNWVERTGGVGASLSLVRERLPLSLGACARQPVRLPAGATSAREKLSAVRLCAPRHTEGHRARGLAPTKAHARTQDRRNRA